jgi:uncharacterized protein YggE
MDTPSSNWKQNPRLAKVLIAVFSMLALFLLLESIAVITHLVHDTTPATNTITVQGEGKATALPDVATITFSVMDTESSVEAAQTKATTQTNAAIAAVKAFGIKDTDVQTTGYNVSPQYSYANNPCAPGMLCPQTTSAPTITGYQVEQTVSVKVRDTSKAGDVLQKLGSLGVQNISGPDFEVDNPDAVQSQARADAIAKAKTQAQLLSKQLGVHLGKVVSFSDNSNNQVYPTVYGAAASGIGMKAAVAPAPQLPTGQNEYDESVSVTYEIW